MLTADVVNLANGTYFGRCDFAFGGSARNITLHGGNATLLLCNASSSFAFNFTDEGAGDAVTGYMVISGLNATGISTAVIVHRSAPRFVDVTFERFFRIIDLAYGTLLATGTTFRYSLIETEASVLASIGSNVFFSGVSVFQVSAPCDSGAFILNDSSITIIDSTWNTYYDFYTNGYYRGAIFAHDSNVTVRSSQFTNAVYYNAMVSYVFALRCNVYVENTLFEFAYHGSHVYARNSSVTVRNTIHASTYIVDNLQGVAFDIDGGLFDGRDVVAYQLSFDGFYNFAYDSAAFIVARNLDSFVLHNTSQERTAGGIRLENIWTPVVMSGYSVVHPASCYHAGIHAVNLTLVLSNLTISGGIDFNILVSTLLTAHESYVMLDGLTIISTFSYPLRPESPRTTLSLGNTTAVIRNVVVENVAGAEATILNQFRGSLDLDTVFISRSGGTPDTGDVVCGMVRVMQGRVRVSNLIGRELGSTQRAYNGLLFTFYQSDVQATNILIDGMMSTESCDYYHVLRSNANFIYANNSVIALSTVTAFNNSGGFIYCEASLVTITRLTAVNMSVTYTGGVIMAISGSVVNISDSSLNGCTGGIGCFAYLVDSQADFKALSTNNVNVTGYFTYFYYRSQPGAGGAIYARNCIINVIDSSFFNGYQIAGAGDCRYGIVPDSYYYPRTLCGGAAIAVMLYSVLVVDRCEFYGNVAERGGALLVDLSVMNVSSSTFTQNSAGIGGALFGMLSCTPPLLAGNTFTANTANYAGATFVWHSFEAPCTTPTVVVSGEKYYRNSASGNGSNLLYIVQQSYPFGLTPIMAGRSHSAGAAFFAVANISNSVFQENSAPSFGGAFDPSGYLLTFRNVTCVGNSAFRGAALGPGMYALFNSRFSANSATYGGVMTDSFDVSAPYPDLVLTVSGCHFFGNRARSGGVMYMASYQAAIENSTFLHNTAFNPNGVSCGGVICRYSQTNDLQTSLTMFNVTFDSNAADQYSVGGWRFVSDGKNRSADARLLTFRNNFGLRDMFFIETICSSTGLPPNNNPGCLPRLQMTDMLIENNTLAAGSLVTAIVPVKQPAFKRIRVIGNTIDARLCTASSLCGSAPSGAISITQSVNTMVWESTNISSNSFSGFIFSGTSSNLQSSLVLRDIFVSNILFTGGGFLGWSGGITMTALTVVSCTGSDFSLFQAPTASIALNSSVFAQSTFTYLGYFGTVSTTSKITSCIFDDIHSDAGFFTLGTISITNVSFSQISSFIFSASQKFSLTNVNISECFGDGDAPIVLFGAAVLTASRSTFQGNDFLTAGGVSGNGSWSFSSVVFQSNTGGDSGALENQGFTTVTGCTFDGNQGGIGGAIVATGNLVSTDTSFMYNGGSVGAIQAKGVGVVFDMRRATFSGNKGSQTGGAMSVDVQSLTLRDVVVVNNTAGADGGGISATALTLNMGNIQFVNNKAGRNGGGFYSPGASVLLSECIFSNNEAARAGGGIFAIGAVLTSITMVGNRAGAGGGGAIFTSGSLTASNVTMQFNVAGGPGGGMNTQGGGTIDLSIMFNNTATTGGGIATNGTTSITNSQLNSNFASGNGGAILCDKGCSGSIATSSVSGNRGDYGIMYCDSTGLFTLTPPLTTTLNANLQNDTFLLAKLCTADSTIAPPIAGRLTDPCVPVIGEICHIACNFGSSLNVNNAGGVYTVANTDTSACVRAPCPNVQPIAGAELCISRNGQTQTCQQGTATALLHGDSVTVQCTGTLLKCPNENAKIDCSNGTLLFNNGSTSTPYRPASGTYLGDLSCSQPHCTLEEAKGANVSNCLYVLPGETCTETCLPGYVGDPSYQYCNSSKTFDTDIARAACRPCRVNMYFQDGNPPQCLDCINGLTATEASLRFQCKCSEGFYEKSGDPADCSACPAGGLCKGGSTPPYSMPGFYYTNATGETVFVKCQNDVACPGNNTCGVGYKDYLCANCIDGYYNLNGECLPCPAGGAWQLYVAIVIVSIVVGIILLVITKPTPASERTFGFGSIGVALGFIQIVSTFGDLKVPWTTTTKSTYSGFSTLNFNVEIVRPGCIVKTDFYSSFKIQMYIPFFVAAFLVLAFIVGSIVFLAKNKSCTRAKPRIRALAETSASGFLFYLTLAYLNLARTSFSLFSCEHRTDGTVSLNDSPTQLCYTQDWYDFVPLAVFGIVVYVIGIPILLTVTFAVLQKKYGYLVAQRSTFMNFYVAKYGKTFWFWETVITLRKLAIVLITQFYVTDADAQIVLCCAVFFVSGIATLAAKPFQWSRQNFVESVSILGCIVILFCGQVTGARQFSPSTTAAIDGVVLLVVVLVLLAVVFGFVLELSVTLHVSNLEKRLYPKKEARKLVHQTVAKDGTVAALATPHRFIAATPAGALIFRSLDKLDEIAVVPTGDTIHAATLVGDSVAVGGPSTVKIFDGHSMDQVWESPRLEHPVETMSATRQHVAVGLRNGEVLVFPIAGVAGGQGMRKSGSTSSLRGGARPPPPDRPPPPNSPPPPRVPPPPREPPPAGDDSNNDEETLNASSSRANLLGSPSSSTAWPSPDPSPAREHPIGGATPNTDQEALLAGATSTASVAQVEFNSAPVSSRVTAGEVLRLEAFRGPVRAMALAAGFVYAAGSDGAVMKFSLQTLQCIRTWHVTGPLIRSMAVSPTALVVGHVNGRATHIDLATDRITVLPGHRGAINHIAIYEDYILTAGDDGQVTCFDLEEGFYRQSLLEEYEPVQGLCVREGIVYWTLRNGDIKSQKLFAAWDISNVEMSMWRHLASRDKCKLPRALFGRDAESRTGRSHAQLTSYTSSYGKDATVYQELAVLLENVDWKQLPELDAASITQTLTRKRTELETGE